MKKTTTPTVTLKSSSAAYETRHFYDRAGYRVRTGVKNIDFDASSYANAWADTTTSYDAVGNVQQVSREVNTTSGDDVVTTYIYDAADRQIQVIQPEGNTSFTIYDERGMVLRSFYGCSSGASGPASKTSTTLSSGTCVGYTETTTVDSRGNVIESKDGRGNITKSFYDFHGRRIASRDPNGNGSRVTYNDAGEVLNSEAGAIDSSTGAITTLKSRSYSRYDERGRSYQSVQDANLANSEALDLSPVGGSSENPSYTSLLDAGSRTIRSYDANNNLTQYQYDSANRTTLTEDPQGNQSWPIYDGNSNVTESWSKEVAGTGASGPNEDYVTQFEYDQVNRRTRTRVRGRRTSGTACAGDRRAAESGPERDVSQSHPVQGRSATDGGRCRSC